MIIHHHSLLSSIWNDSRMTLGAIIQVWKFEHTDRHTEKQQSDILGSKKDIFSHIPFHPSFLFSCYKVKSSYKVIKKLLKSCETPGGLRSIRCEWEISCLQRSLRWCGNRWVMRGWARGEAFSLQVSVSRRMLGRQIGDGWEDGLESLDKREQKSLEFKGSQLW